MFDLILNPSFVFNHIFAHGWFLCCGFYLFLLLKAFVLGFFSLFFFGWGEIIFQCLLCLNKQMNFTVHLYDIWYLGVISQYNSNFYGFYNIFFYSKIQSKLNI